MTSEEPSEEKGRVLPFAPPAGAARARRRPSVRTASPVEDLGRYVRGRDEEDYAHRMKINAIALVFVALLVFCGLWLADTIAQMRKNQDCVLSGRRGCTPVEMPVKDR
jgi:hypothetical protein